MSNIVRMPIGMFVDGVKATIVRRDGYIMSAKGQNPSDWAVNSWWFTQYKDRNKYTAEQEAKALYWRDNAVRVWDCNGLSEGLYEEYSGVNINTKAKYNYSGWCSEKGKGMIPAEKRAPGMAVFWGDSASTIHHVAYLLEPVNADKPAGDWYIGEARGVMSGCVQTRLYERKPNFWGKMDKYFDYGDTAEVLPAVPELGEVTLLRGMMDREDVKQMQQNLIKLGYDLGKYGADGDFGADTEAAIKAYQESNNLEVTGQYDASTHAAMMKALEVPLPNGPEPADGVTVAPGSWRVRTGPGTGYPTAAIVHGGDKLTEIGTDGWTCVLHGGEVRWISDKALI